SYSVTVFFLQAEDGIRDFHVTGVQTCALPIYRGWPHNPIMAPRPRFTGDSKLQTQVYEGMFIFDSNKYARDQAGLPAEIEKMIRSEERRVGKECRARWAQ